jgi:succinyl-CoA synthetase beta subunit
MNIHEYQAKELLQKFGAATPRDKAASTPDALRDARHHSVAAPVCKPEKRPEQYAPET